MIIEEKDLAIILPKSYIEDRIFFIKNLDSVYERFGMSENVRGLCAFIAQVGHESGELRLKSENLNYSADALIRLFGKYFESYGEAQAYARRPEAIANRIYANRMGNGDEKSGDGWKYRGRGLIQITGKDNYKRLSSALNKDYVKEPALLTLYPDALWSAGWFWSMCGLDKMALLLDDISQEEKIFKEMTRKINGRFNGLEHRREIYDRAKKVLM